MWICLSDPWTQNRAKQNKNDFMQILRWLVWRGIKIEKKCSLTYADSMYFKTNVNTETLKKWWLVK